MRRTLALLLALTMAIGTSAGSASLDDASDDAAISGETVAWSDEMIEEEIDPTYDEVIEVDLSLVPPEIEKIAFTTTIYDADKRMQNFGQVSNAYIHIMDETSGTELIRYDLGEDFSIETAVVVGELYKHGGEWKFNAIGSGFQGGLAALCGHYGIDAE